MARCSCLHPKSADGNCKTGSWAGPIRESYGLLNERHVPVPASDTAGHLRTLGTVAAVDPLALARIDQKSGAYLSLLPDSFGPQRHRCRRFIYPIQHRPCHRRSALNSSQKMQRHKSLETNSLLNFSAFGNSEIFRPRRKPYKRFF